MDYLLFLDGLCIKASQTVGQGQMDSPWKSDQNMLSVNLTDYSLLLDRLSMVMCTPIEGFVEM